MRGSPELGSVRVIRPSVDWLLTAVFGMSRLIIGQKAIRRVDRQVHAVPAARRLSVHDRQPPPLLVDAIRCGLGSISVCGVQEPSLSIDDEIRRVREILQQLNQRPAGRFAAEDAEPLATTAILRGEAADIHECRHRVRGRTLDVRGRRPRSCGDRCRHAGDPRQKLSTVMHQKPVAPTTERITPSLLL